MAQPDQASESSDEIRRRVASIPRSHVADLVCTTCSMLPDADSGQILAQLWKADDRMTFALVTYGNQTLAVGTRRRRTSYDRVPEEISPVEVYRFKCSRDHPWMIPGRWIRKQLVISERQTSETFFQRESARQGRSDQIYPPQAKFKKGF